MQRKIADHGANELATKVRRRCGEVYAYANVTGRAKYNPARDLAAAKQRFQRGHYASRDASELPAFLTALETTSGNIMVNFAVRLLMFTGLCPGALRKGKCREIDFDNALSEIPAECMKARRPHLVPLSSQAIDLLRSVHDLARRKTKAEAEAEAGSHYDSRVAAHLSKFDDPEEAWRHSMDDDF